MSIGPGDHPGRIGVVPSMGLATVKVKVDQDFLPVTYSWDAGDKSGSFRVTKETPDQLWVDIDTGQVRDEHTEIRKQRQIEVKDQPIIQHEVVE